MDVKILDCLPLKDGSNTSTVITTDDFYISDETLCLNVQVCKYFSITVTLENRVTQM